MARGQKTGGRVKGTPNRATVEKQLVAARVIDAAVKEGKPLAKDRIEELMGVAFGAMRAHQPVTKEMAEAARAAGQPAKATKGNWKGFGSWWDRAVYAAKELARYQSPTFRAIVVAGTAPGEAAGAPAGSAPDEIAYEGEDAVTVAQQTYLRLVKG